MHKLDMAHKALLICTFAFVLYIAISCTVSFGAYESVLVSDKDPLSLVSEDGSEVYGAVPDSEGTPYTEASKTGIQEEAGASFEETSDTEKAASSSGKSDSKSNTPIGIININTAGAYELDRLPGVGSATAEKIIAYRESHGPFKSVNDLMLVSGIGEKKLADMLPYITVD